MQRLDKHDEVLEISTKQTSAIEQKNATPEIDLEENPVIEETGKNQFDQPEQEIKEKRQRGNIY